MAETHMTKIALVQMRCGPDPDKNFARALDFIRAAAKKGAAIVCLAVLFRSQYSCQTEDHKHYQLAGEIPGRAATALEELLGARGGANVAALVEERWADAYPR